ncbi:MAG: DUF1684 domain-containing protein, partial [Chitinophagaceae bacterium]|nr:DUF1684 domain-containing protein [Chitinophagaceae bacterium]
MKQSVIRKYIFVLCIFLVQQCIAQDLYHQEIDQWKKERLMELKSEQGWLNLAGLFWIKEGKQYFGGTSSDDIQFPIPSLPARVGYFERKGNIVKQVLEKDIAIYAHGVMQKEVMVFHPDSVQPIQISFAHYRWTFLQRDELIGIRFRDLKHPAVDALQTIPCFPIDTLFRIQAKLIPSLLPKKIPIANVLGQITQQLSPGKLVFNLQGETYSLDALQEGNKLFIVFGDQTCGRSTYASGRYL